VLGRPVPPEASAPAATPPGAPPADDATASPKAADEAVDAANKFVPADASKKEAKP
jgi:hypothetical protein